MKDDRLYLLHISESLERIEEYVVEGKEAFFADRKTQDAVLRNLQTLACKGRPSAEVRARGSILHLPRWTMKAVEPGQQ